MDFRIILFVISLIVAAPVMFYYYRRNPNPRFRPALGEMVLIGVLTLGLCGTAAFYLGGVMNDPESVRADIPGDMEISVDGGGSSDGPRRGGKGGSARENSLQRQAKQLEAEEHSEK